jgi:hypothetical protein
LSKTENTIADLKKYLSDAAKPITMEEFKEFWETCSEDEKQEFKQTKLK